MKDLVYAKKTCKNSVNKHFPSDIRWNGDFYLKNSASKTRESGIHARDKAIQIGSGLGGGTQAVHDAAKKKYEIPDRSHLKHEKEGCRLFFNTFACVCVNASYGI